MVTACACLAATPQARRRFDRARLIVEGLFTSSACARQQAVLDHDYAFFAGDLNYRIELDRQVIESRIFDRSLGTFSTLVFCEGFRRRNSILLSMVLRGCRFSPKRRSALAAAGAGLVLCRMVGESDPFHSNVRELAAASCCLATDNREDTGRPHAGRSEFGIVTVVG